MRVLAHPGQIYRSSVRPGFHMRVEEVRRSEGAPYVLEREVLAGGQQVYGLNRFGRDRAARILIHLAPLAGGNIGLPEPYERVPEVEQSNINQPSEGDIDMAKKSKKRTKHEEAAPAEAIAATALAVEEPGLPEADAAPEEQEAATPALGSSRRARKPKAKQAAPAKKQTAKPRAEYEAVLDLEPADDIKPVRAGTQLAAVLKLTARPDGATAVELDKAIVTTAKSVKHYGIWSLRYALHKSKGYGFRTVLKEGEPARYHLVLPKGASLESLLASPAGRARKSEAAPLATKRRGAKKSRKSSGRKLAVACA